MITYNYKCSNCGFCFETMQSIKDKPLSMCCKCLEDSLERVIEGGLAVFVDNGPSTLEGLADRNTKKMGKYELQEKRYTDKLNQVEKKNLAQQELARKYGVEPVIHKVDDEKKVSASKINKMTPEQKRKYIETGIA